MANAIPVTRKPKEEEVKSDEPKQAAPKQEAADEIVPGKDHPVLGKWFGSGWRKDH